MNLETSSAATSGTSAYKNEDEDMEDVVTSNPGIIFVILSLLCRLTCGIPNEDEFLATDLFTAPPNIIDLPDDDEDEPQRPLGRRNRKTFAGKTPQSTPVAEPVI